MTCPACTQPQLSHHCRECGAWLEAGKPYRVDVNWAFGRCNAIYERTERGARKVYNSLRGGKWMGNEAVKTTPVDYVAIWQFVGGNRLELVDWWVDTE